VIRRLAVAVVGLALASAPLRAEGVTYELEAEQELLDDGWTLVSYEGEPTAQNVTFVGSGMRLQSDAPLLWQLGWDESIWAERGARERGWWMEVALAFPQGTETCGQGDGATLSVDDGAGGFSVIMQPDATHVTGPDTFVFSVAQPTTPGMHRWQLSWEPERGLRLSIDDEVVLEEREAVTSRLSAPSLRFGHWSTCQDFESVWDRVAFGTFARGEGEGDVDLDGVTNEADNCPWTPNPAQDDVNSDRRGDACDPCQSGELVDVNMDGVCDRNDQFGDDRDGDGLPDGVDACPDTPGDLDSPDPGCPWGFFDDCVGCGCGDDFECEEDFFDERMPGEPRVCAHGTTSSSDAPPALWLLAGLLGLAWRRRR
jgi:MYXO-CTERM domain-containing protein